MALGDYCTTAASDSYPLVRQGRLVQSTSFAIGEKGRSPISSMHIMLSVISWMVQLEACKLSTVRL